MKFYSIFLVFALVCSNRVFCDTQQQFCNWWSSFRDQPNIPSELKEMEDYFIDSDLVRDSSEFWNFLNRLNIEQIVRHGYENFKQTITTNYFTWVVNQDHPYAINLKQIQIPVKLPAAEIYKTHDLFTKEESIQYNLITQSFLNYILSIDGEPFLEKLEEPLIGNPPCLVYKNRRVSQDIFNSLLEYIPISKHCSLDATSRVIEIGAGSGRTAFCFISLLPHVKYVIADLPPALYISQTYLSEVFPSKKVMKFRHFETFEEIASEYEQADIIFLAPDQLKKLPNQSGDLFLAVDCIHEMKPDTVAYYFREADRLCSHLYFKCWKQTTVPYDNVTYSENSYPVDPQWKQLFKEDCIVPSDFFHAFYRMH